jgi:Ca2+-binding RTX toxin-like protein
MVGGVAIGADAPPGDAEAPLETVTRCATRQLTGVKPYLDTWDLDHDGSDAVTLSFAYASDNEEVAVVDTTTGARTRVTTTAASTTQWIDVPSISGDGSLVAFSTNYDLVGDKEETDRVTRAYLYDIDEGTTERLTDDVGAEGFEDAELATVTPDGTKVVFWGDGAVGLDYGIYALTLATGDVTPRFETETWFHPAELGVDGDGSHVVFAAEADVTGDNADLGRELFLVEGGDVTQLTGVAGGGGSGGEGELDGDGSHVVYREAGVLYRHDLATDQRITIGGTAPGSTYFDQVYYPSIDASGQRVAFASGRNLTGQNSDGGWEVYTWDSGALHQVTSSASILATGDTAPVLSGDGERVLFHSRADLTGQNAGGVDQLFLACSGGPPPPPPRCDGMVVTVNLAQGQSPTAGNDVILGTAAANTINGLGGNDRICGGGGNDVVNGGAGNDRVLGGAGKDTVRGGAGTDRLVGGGGNDSLQGGAGTDTLLGEAGADRLDGGPQRDTCNGGPQRDTQTGCEVRQAIP